MPDVAIMEVQIKKINTNVSAVKMIKMFKKINQSETSMTHWY